MYEARGAIMSSVITSCADIEVHASRSAA